MTFTIVAAVPQATEFWHLMRSNDFRSVGAVLADEFALDWPQRLMNFRLDLAAGRIAPFRLPSSDSMRLP